MRTLGYHKIAALHHRTGVTSKISQTIIFPVEQCKKYVNVSLFTTPT